MKHVLKKMAVALLLLVGVMCLKSCYTTKYVDYLVSEASNLRREFIGKTKSYIVENFYYPITDVKHIDGQYEILVSERSRGILAPGVTHFYIKDGRCYRVETNEYRMEKKLKKVSIFD